MTGFEDREPAPAKAGTREWTGLVALAIPCMLVSMNSNLLNLALPQLTADLRPTNGELLWIADSYTFLVAGFLITMGMLGDRLGRRRVLLLGAAAFGMASVLAATSVSAPMLIAARALLGVAGATLMPSTLSLIRTMFPEPRQRAAALGGWTASFALGGIVGPVVGGLLLGHFSWRSIFLVAPPAMLALVLLGPRLLPEFRDPDAGRVDLTSALLSLVAALPLVFGVTSLAEKGAHVAGWLALALGGTLAWAFVRRERRLATPSVDLALFRDRWFSTPLAVNAVAFGVLYGTQLLIGVYLQLVLGLSPLAAGLWTIPSAVGYLVGSWIGPVAANRTPSSVVLAGSLVVAAVGFAMLIGLSTDSGLALYVAGSVVFSLGLAPVYIVTTELTVAAAPPERAGSISAVLETTTNFGGAFGIAILGSVAGRVYRTTLERSDPPGGTSDVWREASTTLGGAVSVAERLPASQAAELVEAARQAFVLAFQRVEVLGAVALLAAAGVTAVTLLGPSASAQRKERAQPSIPQEQSAPQGGAHVDGEEHAGEQGALHPHVSRYGAAQVTGEQHGPQDRGAGYDVEGQADELEDGDAAHDPQGVAQVRERVDHRLDHQQVDDRVEQQEREHDSGQHQAQPARRARGTSVGGRG